MADPTIESPPQAPPPPSEQEVAEKPPEQQNYEELKSMFEEAKQKMQDGMSVKDAVTEAAVSFIDDSKLSPKVLKHLEEYSGAEPGAPNIQSFALTKRLNEEKTKFAEEGAPESPVTAEAPAAVDELLKDFRTSEEGTPTTSPTEAVKTVPAVDELLKDFRTSEEGKSATTFDEFEGPLALADEEKPAGTFAEFKGPLALADEEKPAGTFAEFKGPLELVDEEEQKPDTAPSAEAPPVAEPTYEQPRTTAELRNELLPKAGNEKIKIGTEGMIYSTEQLIKQTSSDTIKALAEQLLKEEKEKLAQEIKAAKEKQPKTTEELKKELLKGKPESLNDDEVFTIIKSYSQKYNKQADNDPDLALLAKKLLREESGKRMRAKQKKKPKKKQKK